jgi:translation elongation factor EF-Tu-like GTPase
MDGPHIKARLTHLPTESGDRKSPIFSGYRPQFRYLGQGNDVTVDLLSHESLFPGRTAEVNLTFIRPEFQLRRIAINTVFELAEGRRPVARGTIIEVLQPELDTGESTS